VKNSPTIVALRNRAAESVDPDDDEEDEDDEDDDDEKNNKKKTKIFVDTTSVS
jgi:TATA-binding protein-associated factor Taf7